jgi:hypothetical protein
MDYYDWMSDLKTCGKCGWVGLGKEAKIGECFNECAEYHCPKCGDYIDVVLYPSLTENLIDPRANSVDRLFAEVVIQKIPKH